MCTALGYPAPKLYLHKASNAIVGDCMAQMTSKGLYSTQCQVHINSTVLTDAGVYTCSSEEQGDVPVQYKSLYIDVWRKLFI